MKEDRTAAKKGRMKLECPKSKPANMTRLVYETNDPVTKGNISKIVGFKEFFNPKGSSFLNKE